MKSKEKKIKEIKRGANKERQKKEVGRGKLD